ncbi:uncharacterized protein LOC121920330 [Sceloporus undulatus]|uniref:uncharacterized protein LOC121920330 n=1 Tax=Sceloporus undulatus TaxID=8520 RepID=UPI001C4D10DD|nr:uncharacterized protein LOC121920330 [Sceloporus undulatus]
MYYCYFVVSSTFPSSDALTIDADCYSTNLNVASIGKGEKKYDYSCLDNCHDGPVVAVDSCENLSIFLSCGSDTVIKLWNLQKFLLAEITLDNTLSTACFLNSSGDILLAFKGDLYIMSHSKALDISTTNTETATVSAAESYIFESQPQDDQEKIDVSKSIEMATYLEPYKGFAFTEDFTSELQVLPKKKGKESWRLPIAPSEVYCSPCTSEGSLKIFDFLLQPVTPNLEEQDKAIMSRKMIVTKDMKYVPGPKSALPTECEIPFFGVSPCSSLVHEELRIKTQPEEQISEAVNEASTVEPLPESLHEKQHQISEEISPELLEIMPENAPTSIKTKTLEPLSGIDSDVYENEEEKYPSTERQTRSVKFGTWSSRLEGKAAPLDSVEVQEIKTFSEKHVSREHIRKKLRMERKVLKRMRTPKHAKIISVPKSAMRSRKVTYTSYTRSSQSVISVGQQKEENEKKKDNRLRRATWFFGGGSVEEEMMAPQQNKMLNRRQRKKPGIRIRNYSTPSLPQFFSRRQTHKKGAQHLRIMEKQSSTRTDQEEFPAQNK